MKIDFPSEEPIEMKFKVVLRDPYDPMRGRYVVLNVEPDRIPASIVDGDIQWRYRAYLILERDENGFGKAVRVTKDRKQIKENEVFKFSTYNTDNFEGTYGTEETPRTTYYTDLLSEIKGSFGA